MDGYSVKDAAIVLGIPERRVWELIARGVLSSAPEGPDGMRVFLQPRPAPQPVQEARPFQADEPAPRHNGNGGTAEMSPFRELLTEFRSLTERYGQALLALGEARGEVAALRTRVELLEARMDLRLPGTRPASTVAWEIPGYATGPEDQEGAASEVLDEAEEAAEQAELADAVVEPEESTAEAGIDLPTDEEAAAAEELMAAGEEFAATGEGLPELFIESLAEEAPAEPLDAEIAPEAGAGAAADAEIAPEADAEAELPTPSPARQRRAETRRRKIRGGRTALVGIAEALARAEDPTLAELPGAEEAAEALVALQRDIQAARDAAAAPQEAVADELEPQADVEDFVDVPAAPPAGELAEEMAEDEAAGPEAVSDEVELTDAGAEPESEAVDATFEPIEAAGEAPPEPAEAIAEPELEPMEASVEPEAETQVAEATFEPIETVAEPPQVEPEESEVSRSPYTTDVVEPDWFADGDFTWLEAAQAEADAHGAAAPSSEMAPEPVVEAEVERAPSPVPESTEEVSEAAEEVSEATKEPDGRAPQPPADFIEPEVAPVAEAEAEPAAADHAELDVDVPATASEPFEPSAEAQVQAEEQSRAAIQDAFEEPEAPVEPPFETSVEFEAPPIEEVLPPPEEAVSVEPSPEDQAQAEEQSRAAIQGAFEEPGESVQEPTETPAEFIAQPIEETIAPAGEAVVAEPEPEVAPEPEAELEPESEAIQEAFTESQPPPDWPTPDLERGSAVDSPPPDAAPRPPEEFVAPSPEPESYTEPVAEPAAAEVAPDQPVASRAGEEELMWLGDEFEEANLEIATQGWRSPDESVAPTTASPVLELSDAELSQLAEDEGWDRAEVEAIRSLLGRPSGAAAPTDDADPLSTPDEPDDPNDPKGPGASSAPDVTSGAVEPAPDPTEDAGDDSPDDVPPGVGAQEPEAAAKPTQRLIHPTGPMLPSADPLWLKGRRGPAATAYRRLRRLFPG
jgi:hypothetical protein